MTEDVLENQEISWDVDGIAVNATLTLQAAGGPRPGVVLVAGSGPTDRDWNSPLLPGTNGSGKLVAEAVARAGFVTLRYDKRGSGPHARENAMRLSGKVSMQSHLDELAGAVAALLALPEVDPNRIYALTNSEGAIHALNYQRQVAEPRFGGLVLTGVPGRSIAATMRSQVVPQLLALPGGAEMIPHYDAAVAEIAAGRSPEPDPALPEALNNVLSAFKIPANNPFARQLLVTDPAQLVRDVPEPALVVIGKKDIQVNWQVDGQALQAAMAGRDNVTFVFPENANHVLKHEPRPREELVPADVQATYNDADRVLDPNALATILSWLRQQVIPDKPQGTPIP